MQLSGECQKVSLVEGFISTLTLTLPRGLPLGYLTQLEKRLADTELALFEALATLRSLDHDETALVKASVKPGNASRRSKHARMEEWGRLPLRDGMTEDIRDWWNAKTENYTIHQPDEGRIQTQRNPISVSYSPASTSRIASNNVRASSVASVVEAPVSTGTPPNYQRNLHYGNDISRQPPPETVASREHTISEVNTEYPDLQILDARDGEKAAVLASEQSNLYF